MTKTCIICNTELKGKQRRFCSNTCKGRLSNNKFQDYASQKLRSLERKIYFVKKFGGECGECGYKKNLGALCFHHKDGGITKDFGVDSRQFSNRSIKTLELELAKCELLCANCHMEIHHPSLENWWDVLDSNQRPSDYLQALTNEPPRLSILDNLS